MRQWVARAHCEEIGTDTLLFDKVYTDIEKARKEVKRLNGLHSGLGYHYSLVELVDVEDNKVVEDMTDNEREIRQKEIWAIANELDDIIDYDEWSAREYGETKVDTFGTAYRLYEAGYRKVKDSVKESKNG